MELSKMHKTILQDCLHDYVGLWDVIKSVYPEIRINHPLPDWVLHKVLGEVREMLGSGLFVVGFHDPENKENEFTPLTLPDSEIINLISNEWKNRENENNNLYIGYYCWFQATPDGKKLAQDLGLI